MWTLRPSRRSFCTRRSMTTSALRTASSTWRTRLRPGASVDDGDVEVLSEQMGRAGIGVADDQDIHANGVERRAGIHQRFALFDTGTGGLNERRDRAQRFGGDFERRASAGRSFVEKQADAFAA